MNILPAYLYVSNVYICGPQKAEWGVLYTYLELEMELRIILSHHIAIRYWEQNPGSL